MQRLNYCISLLFFSFLLIGCSDSEPARQDPLPFEQAKSDMDRDTTPSVTSAQTQELVAGNTQFALDLYGAIADSEGGNLFYSPFSISIALAMTYAGAENGTQTEMASIFHYTLPEPQLHQAFNTLDLDLSSRGTGDASEFRLHLANALWGQTGYHFETPFLDTLALNYGSGLNLMDFITDPDGARVTINDWVEEQTEDRIQDLIPEGAITSDTRLVLTNAIYFFGEWLNLFDSDNTAPGDFHKDDGSSVSVDMMHQALSLPSYQGVGYEAVALPYKGETVSLLVIAPDAGTMDTFEQTLDATLLTSIVNALQPTYLQLTMPKFTFEHRLPLKNLLMGMGLHAPFTPGVADFSGVDGTTGLVITDILHKAFIAVNERGTEAAAATAVVEGITSVPPVVTLDRPFLFMVRDNVTGTILFMGRLADPS
ncbi:serpin family protein [Myxococcota bacterium]|nr:serpin family protein [Myxococcota bacterium]MBU1536715.1 serpin family protein [Myxococcota bacterium]